jgi:hypothetical protein
MDRRQQTAVAELNREIDPDEHPGAVAAYRLDPATLFLTDEHLDDTLVVVRPGADGRAPGQEFGGPPVFSDQWEYVALHHSGGGRLTEVITNNPKDRAHSIEEYLADRRVADAIGAALR